MTAGAPGAGRAGLVAVLTCAGAVVLISLGVRSLFGDRLQPGVRLEGRSRIAMLDTFDAGKRPVAIVYDPLRRITADAIPPFMELAASPELRRPRQAVPLIFNARFSLPAGRYEVELRARDGLPPKAAEGRLALQIGRIGPPLATWAVTFDSSAVWRHQFSVPIDVNFAGFRASGELEPTVAALHVRPVSVVDSHARLPVGQVLAAYDYGSTTVYFHAADTWVERAGFWTTGRASVPVTIATDRSDLRIRVHSGPVKNTVLLESRDWSQRLDLQPGIQRDVVLPASADGVIPLRITTSDGFVPAEIDVASQDRRYLGTWIELGGT